MKNNLLSSTCNAVEKEWLTRWKEHLGNPDSTLRQVMQTYVEDLDITVAHLDDIMDWGCWDVDAFEEPNVADV